MATPIFQNEGYYAPAFRLAINGQSLNPVLLRDVTQVTYRDKMDELDSVELNVNNWDQELFKPKYEPPSKSEYKGIFEPGNKLDLIIGYAATKSTDRIMMTGEITSLEPVFPESGVMTIAIRAMNVLSKYRKKQHTWGFDKNSIPGAGRSGIRDSEIAKLIGQWKVSDQKPGLDMEVDIEGNAFQGEAEQPSVFMNNQYDIVFLVERARLHGYSLFVDVNPKTKKERLNFRRSTALKDITYELAWGTSLAEFRPTLTTARQIKRVKVMGWDGKAGKPIVGQAEWGKGGINLNDDQKSVVQAVEGREEIITDIPVTSKKQADEVAAGILRDRLYQMIKATATTVGLPNLRAGSRLSIQKLGPRFSGEYFVTDTTHTIGDSGYRTTFGCRREKQASGATQ